MGEGLHNSINQTGTALTLLGGLETAYHYDVTAEREQSVALQSGVRHSYSVLEDSGRLMKSSRRTGECRFPEQIISH